MKGVFEISGSSRYDDLIDERYHFPKVYLPLVQQCVGDWIVYRETRSGGGRMAYIAVARVVSIDPDSRNAGHFYARVKDFLPFDRHVPYRDANGRFAERLLRDLVDTKTVGQTLRGRSVRILDSEDFAAIVDLGLVEVLDPANAIRLGLETYHVDAGSSASMGEIPTAREIEQILVNRKVRDAAFRKAVLDAYDCTCAITGLRIINGGGKAEAQAAHIWSVAEGGPDIVQNGIALSATAHWLFDRHLISLTDDFQLLVSHNKVPAELRTLFPSLGQQIRLPRDKRDRPRLEYIARHRERFAGGWM